MAWPIGGVIMRRFRSRRGVRRRGRPMRSFGRRGRRRGRSRRRVLVIGQRF